MSSSLQMMGRAAAIVAMTLLMAAGCAGSGPKKPVDTDRDGVIDLKDRCLHTAQGVKVYTNGCPVDTDGDKVRDGVDRCPLTAPGAPVDQNGCPFDSDSDTVQDHLDRCPGSWPNEKVGPTGCPLDSDGDGVPDDMDRCPTQRGGPSGCPKSDSDGDGIPDELDLCPGTPPGMSVGADGCPLDSDGDGIVDSLDECPNTRPGMKVLPSGCALMFDCRKPESGEAVDAQGCANGRRFVLRGVTFEFDSAKLTRQAEIILDAVAQTMLGYPEITVEVQGHTDSTGTDGYNLGLSERRSEAVALYLSDKGVPSSHMKPVGYGESVPVATNATPEGQEENRRVEFRVLD